MKRVKREVFRYKGGRRPRWRKALVALVLAGALIFTALLGAVLYGSYDHIDGEPEIMVVLGCMVYPWGPSILLQDRLDEALDYWEDHPEMTVVVSGGQGPDEHISEAQAMYDYFVSQGMPPEQILMEDRSSNTLQNLRFSRERLEGEGYDLSDGVLVVSNGFHLTRARMLAAREGYGEISTLAAPSSHLPSRLKMYVREPLALVKSFLLDH